MTEEVAVEHHDDGDIVSEFHICACGGHAIKVELLDWTQFGGKVKEVVVSLWGLLPQGRPNRLQQVWYIIRYGNPYVGDVCLTVDEAQKLGEELIKMSKEEL